MNRRISSLLQLSCLLLIAILVLGGCAKREATKAITQAQTAKEEAQQAQAPGYAKKEYDDANNLLNLANQQFENGNYEQAIETAQRAESRFIAAREVVPVVKKRVDAQRQKIEGALTTAEENIQKARDAGALSPEEINPVAERVNQLRTEYMDTYRRETDEEKLNNFLAQVEDVRKQTESLATAHLKPQATEAKNEIQNMLQTAQELKADVHVPEKYGQVMELWNQLESAEQEGQWQDMIDLAEKMKAPLNEIIVAAREKAAGDIIDDLENRIAQAKELGFQEVEAFTNAITQAEQALQDGKDELNNQQYAAAISAADAAKGALADGYEALGQEAQTLIEDAQSNIQQAVDQEAETYAPSVLNQARETIAAVQQHLENEQFAEAYRTARQAAQVSSKAIEAARRGKAQQALSKVEQPFSRLHAQGGAKYVPEAYNQAQSVVQDLRTKMRNGQYDAVVEGVPSAVEVVNQGIQVLAQAARDFIDKAQTALEEAETAKAKDWVPMQYANAVNLKSAAAEELEQDRYLSAIRNAESSIKAAKEAEARAYQLQTEQNLQKANDLITLAKRAEQDRLSPLAYRKAVNTIEEASNLYKSREYQESYHKSEQAVDQADKALNNLIIQARNNVDSALAAKAMTYSQPEIQKALALLNEAEEAQKAERFSGANEKALESADLAQKAERFTWRQRSYALLKEMEGTKEILQYHLAPQKQPALYREVLENLAEARVRRVDDEYERSYAFGDKAREKKQQIWQNMEEDLNRQLKEFNQTAEWLGEKSLDKEGREIKIELLNSITELERQIDLEDWKQAYNMANETEEIAQEMSQKLQQRNRKIFAHKLEETLEPYEKQNALEIVPEQKKIIKNTFETLSKPTEGQTYAEVYEQYQNAKQAVDNLPSLIQNTATQRMEEVTSILQQAQEAGANKHFKDWYRSVASDLQWLRNSINSQNYQKISSRLQKLEKESNNLLLATMNANAEEEYFESLDNNLTQMNNLIQDFGTIGDMPSEVIIIARATEHKLDETSRDMYRSLQGEISAKTLRASAEILEERVKEMAPPESLKDLHKKAIATFTHFRKAAVGFETYGQSKVHDIYYREKALENAYQHLYKTLELTEDLQFFAKKGRKISGWESVRWTIKNMEDKVADFYYSFEIK